MKRRTLLISIGGAAGTAGVIGTGAFTSVEADRDVSVTVANENNAYLGIEPSPSSSANSEFATQDSSNADQIALNFDDSGNGGSGVGLSSVYNFDDVFRITNQGTQTIYVWANFGGGDLSDDDIWFYPDGESSRKLNDGTNSVVTVPVGETVKMGVHIDTNVLESEDGDQTLTATLTADVDVPNGSSPSDPAGSDAAVVSQNPDQGEFGSIQAAIDSVSGSTVYIEPGTYEERPVIGSSTTGLTVQGAGEDDVIIDASDDSQFSNAYGFSVKGDKTTLKNFTLKGPVQPSDAEEYPSSYFGLKIQDSQGVEVENVTVEGSTLSEIDLNSVVDATLTNITADGAGANTDATRGTGLFITNCIDIEIDGITTQNNEWGGIGISAWESTGDIPDPTTRNIQLSGTNEIYDEPILYTEEEFESDTTNTYHEGSRNSNIDTDSDGDWNVRFPLDGDSSASHDVTGATINTSTQTGQLSYSYTYKRFNSGSGDQVAEVYFVDETNRDNARDSSPSSGSEDQFTHEILESHNL